MKLILNDLAVEYADEGQGPVVLLLHGWGQNLHTFDKLAAELVKDHKVVRLDLPGFGGSETPSQAWSVNDYTNFLSQFITKIKIHPEIIIGHSMGGQIAVKAVGDQAVAPRKLILVAAAAVRDDRASIKNRLFRSAAKAGKAVVAIPGLRSLRVSLRRRLYAAAGNSDYYAAAANMRPTFLKLISQDVQSDAKRITVPTLLIWGNDDSETPVEQGRKLAYCIKGSRLETVPNAGHFVYLDQPDRVLSIIRNFI